MLNDDGLIFECTQFAEQMLQLSTFGKFTRKRVGISKRIRPITFTD